MKTVCIYIDEGASFATLLREIARELDHSRARLLPVMAEDLVDQDVLAGADVFIMPGGADLPYCAKLNGTGNLRLRCFIESGGTYLGVCAGAYYGCSALSFHAGLPSEVSGARELALLDAVAVGSLAELGPLYDLTLASATAARIAWEGIGTFRGWYHGGPRFDIAADETATVFARYVDADQAPAGVERPVDRGKVVLVGVHVEMKSETLKLQLLGLNESIAYRHLVTLIEDSEAERRIAFRDVLTRAGLPLKAA